VSDLKIMILDNQSQKPLQKSMALHLSNIVDTLNMTPNGKYTIPSGHRIGPDNWMNRLEICSNVLWRSSFACIELEVTPFGQSGMPWLSTSGC
jgi:hypothetical protein